MSKLFFMALTERLGSGLEHQLPAAKVLAVLCFHHVRSFSPLDLEANRTVLLGAWAGVNAVAFATLCWDGGMGSSGCFVTVICFQSGDTSKYAKEEAMPASKRPSRDPRETGPGEKERMEARAWEMSLPSQPGEALI